MCECCQNVLHRERHDVAQCPLRESFYCSLCQEYGHHTNACPDKAGWRTRVPQYQEQLIPYHVREMYNITSCTPLLNTTPTAPELPLHTPVFEILDNSPKSIRAALTSLGVQSKTDRENRQTLEWLVLKQGKKLVYLQNEEAQQQAAPAPAKEKRVIKVNKTKAQRAGLCDEKEAPSNDMA